MNFDLNDDQKQLTALIERFVAVQYHADQHACYRAEPAGFSQSNWRLLADLGLIGFALGSSVPDQDMGPVELISIMEALGRGLVVEPFLEFVLLGGRMIRACGSAEQSARWLPEIASAKANIAFAFAEHGSGYEWASPASRWDGSALSGNKTFAAAGATAFIVPASTSDGTALFLVPADAAGLTRCSYRLIDGSVACELHFEGTPAEPMPGTLPEIEAVLDDARLGACAELVGIIDMLLARTLDYVRQRHQFGRAIGHFQAIQHRLADLYVSVEQSRSHLIRAATSALSERSIAIAAAKSYISKAAIHVGEECIQFHGGMGISSELLIGNGHKRILMLASLLGSSVHEMNRFNTLMKERRAAHLPLSSSL